MSLQLSKLNLTLRAHVGVHGNKLVTSDPESSTLYSFHWIGLSIHPYNTSDMLKHVKLLTSWSQLVPYLHLLLYSLYAFWFGNSNYTSTLHICPSSCWQLAAWRYPLSAIKESELTAAHACKKNSRIYCSLKQILLQYLLKIELILYQYLIIIQYCVNISIFSKDILACQINVK